MFRRELLLRFPHFPHPCGADERYTPLGTSTAGAYPPGFAGVAMMQSARYPTTDSEVSRSGL